MSSMYREGEREMQADENETDGRGGYDGTGWQLTTFAGEVVAIHWCPPAEAWGEGCIHILREALPPMPEQAWSDLCDAIQSTRDAAHSHPVGEEPEPSAINAALAQIREQERCFTPLSTKTEDGSLLAAVRRLLDLLPPEGWPEPLPTDLTAADVGCALRAGTGMEWLDRHGIWRTCTKFWADKYAGLGDVRVVARVAVEPQTELVPLHESFGRLSASGHEIDGIHGPGNSAWAGVGCFHEAGRAWQPAEADNRVRVLVSDEGDK